MKRGKLMLAATIPDIKGFMSLLLKNTVFDAFTLRKFTLKSFITIEMDGYLEKEFYSDEEQEKLTEDYCLWSDVKPLIFQFIKGHKLPLVIKIVLAPTKAITEEIHPNAASLSLNISFENNVLGFSAGSSQKNFALDKSIEYNWDAWVKNYFKTNSISILEEL